MTLNSSQQADRDARIDNRLKLLAHPDRLLGIQTGDFAPPVLVDIDPVDGVCNLDCEWCCQAASRASRPTKFMSEETMRRLGPFSRDWGVKSWRIAGDSEPLLNKNINTLIASGAEAGIDMGLITNGVYLERITPESLERLDWLGVSLDAGTPETWSRLKKSPAENFEKIQRAYEILIDPDKRREYDDTGTVDDDQYDEGEIQSHDIVFPPATREEFEDTAYAFDGDDEYSPSQEELDNASDGEYSQDDGEMDSDEEEETDEEQVRTPPAPAARAKATAPAAGNLRRHSVSIGPPVSSEHVATSANRHAARGRFRAGPPLLSHRLAHR